MAEEIWKAIPGYEGIAEASSLGRIRTLDRTIRVRNRWGGVSIRQDRGRIKVLRPHPQGYLQATITTGGKSKGNYAHVFICSAFHGPKPDGCQVAHFDGDRTNNRPENLRWATPAENTQDRERHGTITRGEGCHFAKLTTAQALAIRDATGITHRRLAEMYGVSRTQVLRIRARTIWRHLPP